VPRKLIERSSVGPDGPLLRGGGPVPGGTENEEPKSPVRPDAGGKDPNPMGVPVAAREIPMSATRKGTLVKWRM
jgi:hypothetical protein